MRDAVKPLFDWLKISPNPASKAQLHAPSVLRSATAEGTAIRKMLEPETEGWFRERNDCMVQLIWSTGMRMGEIVALRVADIDLVTDTITVTAPKTRTTRKAFLTPATHSSVEAWLRVRPNWEPETDALFVSLTGKGITHKGIGHVFRIRAKKRGIVVRAHQLRHNFADELRVQGAPIQSIRELLGHKTLNQTGRYMSGPKFEEQQRAVATLDKSREVTTREVSNG
jgi:site-specific recombinase XerD